MMKEEARRTQKPLIFQHWGHALSCECTNLGGRWHPKSRASTDSLCRLAQTAQSSGNSFQKSSKKQIQILEFLPMTHFRPMHLRELAPWQDPSARWVQTLQTWIRATTTLQTGGLTLNSLQACTLPIEVWQIRHSLVCSFIFLSLSNQKQLWIFKKGIIPHLNVKNKSPRVLIWKVLNVEISWKITPGVLWHEGMEVIVWKPCGYLGAWMQTVLLWISRSSSGYRKSGSCMYKRRSRSHKWML